MDIENHMVLDSEWPEPTQTMDDEEWFGRIDEAYEDAKERRAEEDWLARMDEETPSDVGYFEWSREASGYYL